ncbi:sulfite exporter TauE/SafE family protein [Pelotomaculum terephthalicicum JT]|uniref:sulfite exporter TauE/SafE family protein n=1 Tax=Pelotomaculum TaxID=191373 RepID=UPI0009C8EEA7|nr:MULTISPECIES: sulfite exporter TauE/SafE family protein [Pelotomaculum]MCG9968992.1 sulfite exporter TauE/SafE family protein [Pelotomaculum terephthalicicum JT]OPX87662.1 MAG: Sulfite exporter TauE/SafE [Pelotomaculum sp. PtaB.Bin117]OPY61240.1 MAG: Sulfite exporter TauE/SafE [Pelotomaculum sp. PtaU1.Bin065]
MNFLIGLATGVFGGLIGIGGGVIMIPLMVGILKMEQHKAQGTSLVALVFTGVSGALTYMSRGSVDLPAAIILASTAIFTARAGANFANALPEWKLKRSFGGLLFVATILLLLKSYPSHMTVAPAEWTKVVILLLTGGVTGFLSGMLGVGGGSTMVPAMVLFTGFTQYTAQGSSLLAMIPIGLAGAHTHWRFGNISRETLPGLIPGILLGSFFGGSLAHSLPELALRMIFAVVLVWTGIKFIRTPKSVSETDEGNTRV